MDRDAVSVLVRILEQESSREKKKSNLSSVHLVMQRRNPLSQLPLCNHSDYSPPWEMAS